MHNAHRKHNPSLEQICRSRQIEKGNHAAMARGAAAFEFRSWHYECYECYDVAQKSITQGRPHFDQSTHIYLWPYARSTLCIQALRRRKLSSFHMILPCRGNTLRSHGSSSHSSFRETWLPPLCSGKSNLTKLYDTK